MYILRVFSLSTMLMAATPAFAESVLPAGTSSLASVSMPASAPVASRLPASERTAVLILGIAAVCFTYFQAVRSSSSRRSS